MSPQLTGIVALSTVLVSLALFAILHNPRATANRRFGVSALAITGWITCTPFALSTADSATAILLGRLAFAFASAIPFTLVWLFDAFSSPDAPQAPARTVIPALSCLAFIALSLSPWIVADVSIGPKGNNFIYGPVHRVFGIYFLLNFLFALYVLATTMRSASGLRRLQLRYLLLAIILGGAAGITTNLLIPLIWKTSQYSALGPYSALLWVSFSAHAIIRYRLMDIRVVIKKGAVYVSAIVATVAVFLLLTQSLQRFFAHERNTIGILEAIVLAVAIGIFFQPLKDWIQNSFNRYLYRESYDYHRTIREVSRHLSTILDLRSLLEYLTTAIATTFKTEIVAVFLKDHPHRVFRIRQGAAAEHQFLPQQTLSERSPLVVALRGESRCLVREEAERAHSDPLALAAARELRTLGGELAFALIEDGLVVGFVIVGPKKSGDPYFIEDIDLLSTVVNQAAVATRNAQLYRQVVRVNEYLDNILSAMDSGVIAVDASGEISLFNPAAEHLTGLKSHLLLKAPYADLPAPLVTPLRETLADGRPRPQFETTIEEVSGVIVPLVCSTATLRSRDGLTEGALIVFSDLTRVKDLEHEKRRAERLASFGALASGVAHEIKNPLVAIRTFAELLPERFAEFDFREDFSKVVMREISRIDDLVARLRGIAATPVPLRGAIDIREPIGDTLALLRAQLDQARITVHRDFQDHAPFIATEEGQLKQLFLNLFLNAIQAMGTDGEMTVRISRRQGPSSPRIVAEVSDTGPGIPDSILSNIFEPFFTTKPNGSGLGLAICRGIVDAHHGSIRIENNQRGTGTTVVVELPAAPPRGTLTEHNMLPK